MVGTANSLNISEQGTLYFDGVSDFSGLDAGTAGNVLTSNGTGVAPSFQAGGGGSGNVTGAASSTDNDIVVFDGVTGKVIKDTGISSTAPTFTGNVTSLSTMTVPYDTTAGEGMYFSDGRNAFRQVGTGAANFFFGNAGNSSLSGIANTGVGQASLPSLTNGIQNTAVGNGALNQMTSGGGNAGFGYLSGQGVTTSIYNCAFGSNVLSANPSTGYNNGFGALALQLCTGNFNNAIGYTALQNTTGDENTAIGHAAGYLITTGENNTIIGSSSGLTYTGAESNNIILGRNVQGTVGESQTIRIGSSQSATYIAGISGATVTGTAVLCAIDGQLGTVASSERYKENIEDMPDDVSVLSLRPVKFNYKADENKTVQYGLIAEEVAQDFPYLCFYKDDQPESVKYHELCVFLLAEIQRLEARVSHLENL